MTYTEKRIVESYSDLLEGLSPSGKSELIENLSRSLKMESAQKDKIFYKSFGAFGSDSAAEDIIREIKTSGKFRKKELRF